MSEPDSVQYMDLPPSDPRRSVERRVSLQVDGKPVPVAWQEGGGVEEVTPDDDDNSPDETLRMVMEELDKLDECITRKKPIGKVLPVLEELAKVVLHKHIHSRIAPVGLLSVLRTLRLFPRNVKVSELALRIIHCLSYTPPALAILIEHGVIELVTNALRDHMAIAGVVEPALKTVVNMSCSTQYRRMLQDHDIVRLMLDSMALHSESNTIHKEAMRAIINLQFELPMKKQAVRLGAIEAILDSMESNDDSAADWKLHMEALRCLFNLMYQYIPAKDKMYECTGINQICNSMKRFGSHSDDLLLYGFEALAILAIAGEKFRAEMRFQGVQDLARDAKARKDGPGNAKLYLRASEVEGLLKGQAPLSRVRSEGKGAVWFEKQVLPLGHIIKSLETRVQASFLITDLMLYIPFLIMFMVFFYGNQRTGEQTYYAVQAFRVGLIDEEFKGPLVRKAFHDIASDGDWYDWLNTVVIPGLWPAGQEAGGLGRMPNGHSMLLGSLRIRVLRVDSDSCAADLSKVFVAYDDAPPDLVDKCWAKFSEEAENRSAHLGKEWQTCQQTGEPKLTSDANYPCTGIVWDVPFNATLAYATAEGQRMQDEGFVDLHVTRLALTEFMVYLPPFDCFASFKMIVEVKAGGTFHMETQLRLFRVWTEADVGRSVFDAVFFAFVLFYVYKYVWQARRSMLIYDRRPLRYFFQFWNMLELVNLVCFLAVFGLKIAWIVQSRRVTDDQTMFTSQDYPAQLEGPLWLYSMALYINSINCLLTFFKLLKYLSMNDNFNILTRTIEKSAKNCIGLLVLFFVVLVAYSLCGVVIYGNTISEFRDFSSAFSTLSQVLLGNLDSYDTMQQESRWLTFGYLASFTVLELYMMLNFLIAILSESFAEVNEEIADQSFDLQVQRVLGTLNFSFKQKSILQRLQLTYNRKSLSSALSDLLTEVLVPYRDKQRTRQLWKKVRQSVLTQGLEHAATVSMDPAVKVADEIRLGYVELKGLMSAEMYALLGDIYFDAMWKELVFGYELERKRPTAQQSSEESQAAQAATAFCVEDMQGRLTDVSTSFNTLLVKTVALRPLMAKHAKSSVQTRKGQPLSNAVKSAV